MTASQCFFPHYIYVHNQKSSGGGGGIVTHLIRVVVIYIFDAI